MAEGSTTVHVRADLSEFGENLDRLEIQVQRIQTRVERLNETLEITRASLQAIGEAREEQE